MLAKSKFIILYKDEGFTGVLSLAIVLAVSVVIFTTYSVVIAPEVDEAENIIEVLPNLEKGADDTVGILDCSMGEHLAYSADFNFYRDRLQPIHQEMSASLPAGKYLCLGIMGLEYMLGKL